MLDINLTHEQQQKAVEQIQELMAKPIEVYYGNWCSKMV